MIKIKKAMIQEILEIFKNNFPNEIVLILTSSNNEIIDGYYILPLIYQSPTSVAMRQDLIPFDNSIIGTAHSHPFGNIPSKADLLYFQKFGRYHIIAKYPFRLNDIALYDFKGNKQNFILI